MDSFSPERFFDENGRLNPTNEVVSFGGKNMQGFPGFETDDSVACGQFDWQLRTEVWEGVLAW